MLLGLGFWRFLRRRKCRSVAVVTFLTLVTYVWKTAMDHRCDPQEAIAILQDLCREYEHNKVTGNLCPHICTMHTIWFDSCLNYRQGKYVFKMRWMDETVIFKSKGARISDFDAILQESLETFMKIVVDTAEMMLPIKRGELGDDEILQRLWMDDIEDYVTRISVKNGEDLMWNYKASSSLWALLQQEEYVLFKFYEDYDIFPKIHGTCGHFYAVEYMPPGNMLTINLKEFSRITGHSWRDRAETALKFLELMESFDNDFPEVLNMCDMKGENFGLSPKGRLAAIDVDMAEFDRKIHGTIGYPNCTKHGDCSFFDCQGWCDLSKNRCTELVVNNNLQKLCDEILTNDESNAYTGLLRSPQPILDKIPEFAKVLRDCARPPVPPDLFPGCSLDGAKVQCPHAPDQENVRYSANVKYYGILKAVLRETVAL